MKKKKEIRFFKVTIEDDGKLITLSRQTNGLKQHKIIFGLSQALHLELHDDINRGKKHDNTTKALF